MKKTLIVLLFAMFLFPVSTRAACTDSEVVALSKMASNVVFTPVFQEETGTFHLIVSNLNPDFYFMDVAANQNYTYTAPEIILTNYKPGKSYRFKFYSAKPSCIGNTILSKYVTLPGYNPYYKDAICEGLENYSFCQKWNNYTYSHSQFAEMVNKYKQEEEQKEEANKEPVMGFYDYVFLYYSKYYYIILPIIIIGCLIAIMQKKKKEEFF